MLALQEGLDPTPCRVPAPHVQARTELAAGSDPSVFVFLAGLPGPPSCVSARHVGWETQSQGQQPCDPCSRNTHACTVYPCVCVCTRACVRA